MFLFTLSIQTTANPQRWSESYTLEKNSDYTGAMDAIRPFIEKPSTAEFTFIRLAWLAYLNAEYNQSTIYYKKALSLNNQSIEALIGLLAPLAAQNRWKETSVLIEKIFQTSPWNYQAHLFLLRLESREAKWDVIQKHTKLLIKKYPSSADPWIFLGRAYRYTFKVPAALEAYQQVLMRYPTNLEANAYINTAATINKANPKQHN